LGVRAESYRGNGHGRRGHARFGLSIVRTLVEPNIEVARLVRDIGDTLGQAFEADKNEKGVALLESRAILHAIKDRRGSVDRRMLAQAEADLVREMRENDLGQTPISVRVHPFRPLKLFGRHRDVLALHLVPDMRLGADRGAIETFVDEYYPSDTDLAQRAKPLEPHITLGKVKPQFLPSGDLNDFDADPLGYLQMPPSDATQFERLIHLSRERLVVPTEVALNGLRIQVDTYGQG
jgi:hypothetical protein